MGSRPLGRKLAAAGAAASVLYSAALVFLRGRPSIDADAGIFLSVAARLVHGDHLYTGVWDNKPPFFYYAQALALDVGGWRGPFFLDALWLSIATVSIWLLLTAIKASPWTRLVGALAYPLMLTGAWYYAGYSELPPLALAPAMAWLCLRGNPRWAGALLGIAVFFRLDYSLLFFSLIAIALIVVAKDGPAMRREALRLLTGFAATVAASIAFLAARGELSAYIDTIRSQVGYPDRTLMLQGEHTGIVGHVTVVVRTLHEDPLRSVMLVLAVAALVALLLMALRRRPAQPLASGRTEPGWMLTAFLLGTAAAAVVTLAFSALWDHSLELIALPATFATCFLVSKVESAKLDRRRRIGAIAATTVACCVAFGGLGINRSGGSPEASSAISRWWHTPRSVSAIALDRVAAQARASGAQVTYGRLGTNADDAHAEFIDQNLELACPIFHQYPFSSNLDEALGCIRDQRPQLLLVGPLFFPLHQPTARSWDRFVSASERLLRTRYTKALALPDDGGTVEVWRRKQIKPEPG